MTKITYLDHSGFMITLPDVILVFDYLRDPSHALHKALEAHPEAPVVFFVSHHHKDHHNPAIYEMAQNHKRVYVMSNDVLAMNVPSTLEVAGMSAGDIIEDLPGKISVKAYRSTDVGVSFMVTLPDGSKIFHAGDLNDWHWQDESTVKEVQKADALFHTIINHIASEVPEIKLAMFPVDARQGSDFARGAKYLLQTIKVDNFFPMHFWDDYKEVCDFNDYKSITDTKYYCLHDPGMSAEVEL